MALLLRYRRAYWQLRCRAVALNSHLQNPVTDGKDQAIGANCDGANPILTRNTPHQPAASSDVPNLDYSLIVAGEDSPSIGAELHGRIDKSHPALQRDARQPPPVVSLP